MRTGQSALYFDFWPYNEQQVYVGWDEFSASMLEDENWASMQSRIRVRAGSILEISIPLPRLMTWPYFEPIMSLYLAVYVSDEQKGHIQLDNMTNVRYLVFPFRDIFTVD